MSIAMFGSAHKLLTYCAHRVTYISWRRAELSCLVLRSEHRCSNVDTRERERERER